MAIATFDDAQTQYLDNLSYEREESVSKAHLFVEACRALLLLCPAEARSGGHSTRYDTVRWSKEMEEARQWIANNPASSASSGAVRFPDFAEFRG